MATDNNIKKISAADIEKYHRGLLSAKEKHELEKAALDDPFLADALEGYAVAGVDLPSDLAELENRLGERVNKTQLIPIETGRRRYAPFLRVAAMFMLFAGAGILIYQLSFRHKNPELAVIKTDSIKPGTIQDSSLHAINTPTATTGDNSFIAAETTKTNNQKAVTAGKNNEGNAAPVTSNKISGEMVKTETDETVKENKPVSTVTPVTIAPAKEAETKTDIVTASGKATEKNLAREENTDKVSAMSKRKADSGGVKDQVAQPVDDNTRNKQITASRGAIDNKDYKKEMNTFRGRVTDPANVGLPFANVTNVQDNVGTYTDAKGNFTLTSTDSVLNVQVRSIGFENNNLQLRNNVPSNQVVMQEDRRGLSEVVISNQKPNAAARSRDANRVVTEPEPADGWVAYDSYLANNLNVPDDFKPQQTEGNAVQVSFEVDKNGEPVNIRVEKSLCSSCDKEAIRLIKDGPKWKRNANKKGRTTVTINF